MLRAFSAIPKSTNSFVTVNSRVFSAGAYLRASKLIKTPAMGESITEGTLTQWLKKVGDSVDRDEQVATIETDKIDVQVNSPEAGHISDLFAAEGDTVTVGRDLFKVEVGAGVKTSAPKVEEKPMPKPQAVVEPAPKQAIIPAKQSSSPPKQIIPMPKINSVPVISNTTTELNTSQPTQHASTSMPMNGGAIPGFAIGTRSESRVKMNRMRARIAERLKESQNTAAALTTFNEIDMSALMALRSKYKDQVLKDHDVKLGFMGAFVKASCQALKAVPSVNARIEKDTLVFADYIDISVAVSTPKGLVTPVVRNCESLSIVQVESAIAALGKKAKSNAITLEDMQGGTFTISNGGVFGSLYGTPIINTPQSAILGMHAIKDRPVVVNGKIEIRPMMYVALTYDHRIIDGREAVTFLVKVKEAIEDPSRILLDV